MQPDNRSDPMIADELHALARRLFPICRSITGNGVRQTLAVLRELLPELRVHEIPSGTKCFDWTIPDEWNIEGARILTPEGQVIADFAENNLHVVGYSEPVDRWLSLSELQAHLHSAPHLPHAIPFVTSYYNRDWGFCISDHQRRTLVEGTYHASIKSTLAPGSLTYADLVIPGTSKDEVLFSTNICHPSMANNELSGPVVAAYVANYLRAKSGLRYTYRFVFIPETIGAIAYIARHRDHLKQRVRAGFNLACVGDERAYSFLPSRTGNSLADRVARHVLHHRVTDYVEYSFLDRGSDERQYCSPGVDLPVVSIMRSKYGTYPEYHTSLDDLNFVTPAGLQGSFATVINCIEALEADAVYVATSVCEPQLGKRGLYENLSTGFQSKSARMRLDILAYCDGQHSLLDIANILDLPILSLAPLVAELLAHGLIREPRDRPTLAVHLGVA